MPYLRSRDAYKEAAWDWSILDGCFGPNIRPSDIDGAVERRGHFLFLEAKSPSNKLAGGQAILLSQLSRQPNTTVLLVNGPLNYPKTMQVWPDGVERECNLGDVRRFCREWFERVDAD